MPPLTFTPKKPLQTPAPLGMSDINALNAQGAQEPMKIDDWMKQNVGDFDHPTHPNTRRFRSGPHKGKTPKQVATKLADAHAKGLASPKGMIGHGAAGGLDTGTMAMSPAEWQARFHSKAPAAAPMAPATMPTPANPAAMTLAGNKPATITTPNGVIPPPPQVDTTARPAAPMDTAGVPGVKTMSNKYGTGSSYDAKTFQPAVSPNPGTFTPARLAEPLNPLAPSLKKNFFA